MEKTEFYGVKALSLTESYIVNGGTDPAEGSYAAGYAVGIWVRNAFTSFADYYQPTYIWGA